MPPSVESSKRDSVVPASHDPEPFEGVEKKLTLRYACIKGKASIRKRVEKDFWGRMVKSVGAEVLSVVSNDKVTAYLLSESSLFVFDKQIILKTCGNTRIFDALPILTNHIAQRAGDYFELLEIIYSRPTFMFPNLQPGCYGKFETEVDSLCTLANSLEIPNASWKLVQSDTKGTRKDLQFHCCVLKNESSKFSWDEKKTHSVDIALFFPDPTRLTEFFKKPPERVEDPMSTEGSETDLEMSTPEVRSTVVASGLSQFLPMRHPDLKTDEYLFEPCGYSMNAILGDHYWTIHITPETKFSYVSFETNSPHIPDLQSRLLEFYSPKKGVQLDKLENSELPPPRDAAEIAPAKP